MEHGLAVIVAVRRGHQIGSQGVEERVGGVDDHLVHNLAAELLLPGEEFVSLLALRHEHLP